MRVPIVLRRDNLDLRSLSANLSPRGLYFEIETEALQTGDRLDLEITLPPGDGVSPYPGRAACRAEVTRVQRLGRRTSDGRERFGVAAKFLDVLRLSY